MEQKANALSAFFDNKEGAIKSTEAVIGYAIENGGPHSFSHIVPVFEIKKDAKTNDCLLCLCYTVVGMTYVRYRISDIQIGEKAAEVAKKKWQRLCSLYTFEKVLL